MANIQFNIAKGRVNELTRRVVNNDPANAGFVIILLLAAQADSALEDYTNVSDLLANAGNTEATFTNYERKILTNAELVLPTVNNTTNLQSSAVTQVVWVSAGGTTDNTLVKGLICYAPDVTSITDATLVPLTAHDVSETTNGNNLTLNAGTFLTSN